MARTRSGSSLRRSATALPMMGPPTPPWRALLRRIRGCTLCELSAHRTHAVAYRGAARPWLLFVGEAPGAEEDRQGVPFVGRAGRLLDRMIEDVRLGPGEYGIVNVLKCRPSGNRFDVRAARACRPYLDQQIALLGPVALVSLGARALRELDPDSPPILQSAGAPRQAHGLPLFPLVHPAATFRSRRLAARWKEDALTLTEWLLAVRPART